MIPAPRDGQRRRRLVPPLRQRPQREGIMEIRRLSLLEGAQEATGIAVIIDVFRAFSCEPVLHALGAERVLLETDVEKCLAQRGRAVLLGELDGSPIDGFDLPNSLTSSCAKARTSSTGGRRCTARPRGCAAPLRRWRMPTR
jgi:hypothetical protein